ncbi:Solute carrier family 13 member 2 [Araneus ventricosus]|uniref:Solute carrier family 13 member 2 n=1 Tax=Araneus ventricosus TaxID=182803 RepID=A0A4Y2UUU2_ARAVE|nr:Solute carrier family 13 member 2 [Araneus ventricosus]
MAAVSTLPLALFPLLGIMSSTEVSKNYMKEGYMTFIGGVMASIAVEDSKLHERIALEVLLLVGTDIKRLLRGFMLTTAFLSMWMPNVAATALMMSIVDAVVAEMSSKSDEIHLYMSTILFFFI